MLFGELGISSAQFAKEFVSGVVGRIGLIDPATKPPCSGGSRRIWNAVVKDVLGEMGKKYGYDATYDWMVDFIWWSTKPERLGLVVESELDPSVGAIEEDFQKLTVFKCPLKLMVFSSSPEDITKMAELYLHRLTQHVKDEEYLLIGFTASEPRCFSFVVPTDGPLVRVSFSELQLSKSAVAGI